MCSKAAHEIVLSSRCRVLRTLRYGQGETAAWPCGSFALPSGAIRLLKDVLIKEEPRLTSFSEQRFCALPTWWFWRGGCTRSHSEPGRETPQRRWYFVLRRGRVGRRQVCKSQKLLLNHDRSAHRRNQRPQIAAFFASAAPQTPRPKAKPSNGQEQPTPTPKATNTANGPAKNPGMPRTLTNNAGWSSPRRPAEGKSLRGPAKQQTGHARNAHI